MGKKELIVFLKNDEHFRKELRLYFQTDIYCRQNTGYDSGSRLQSIISDKQGRNNERKRELIADIKEITGKSDMYVFGELVPVKKGNPKERIEEGFQSLVRKSYPKLQMLRTRYVEGSLKKIFYPDDKSALYSGDPKLMDESEKEMWAFIQRKFGDREELSLKMIYEEFSGKQYGWYFWAVSCVLGKLYIRDSVEFVQGSRTKSKDEVFILISNKKDHEQTRVKPASIVDQTKLEEFKRFFSKVFHKEITGQKMKEMTVCFKKEMLEITDELEYWQRDQESAVSCFSKPDNRQIQKDIQQGKRQPYR